VGEREGWDYVCLLGEESLMRALPRYSKGTFSLFYLFLMLRIPTLLLTNGATVSVGVRCSIYERVHMPSNPRYIHTYDLH